MIDKTLKSDASRTMNEWFDYILEQINAQIRTDQVMIDTGIADNDREEFYKNIFNKNYVKIAETTHQNVIMMTMPYLLTDLTNSLKDLNIIKKFLAMDDGKLMVWFIINDDDEATELQLFSILGQINASYSKTGTGLDFLIFENSENVEPPPHFKELP